MKRAIFLVVVLLMVVTALPASAASGGGGNGGPSGAHYNLNLIGLDQSVTDPNKIGDFDSGNRIFIPLKDATDINLTCSDCKEGDPGGYAVLDGNGLDGDASFMLPNPDNGDGTLAYSVWIRPVAAASKDATISLQSCFTDADGTYCYMGEAMNLPKSNQFKDVSKSLLQVCALVDGAPKLVPLFSDLTAEYFWHLDNNNMRNTQMRFYAQSGGQIGVGTCSQTGHPAH